MLAAKGQGPKTIEELSSNVSQLKLFIDLCHLYGIAVITDVVFNHAGGAFNAKSLDFFDRPTSPGRGNSLYFNKSGAQRSGEKVFTHSEPAGRAFLMTIAASLCNE